MCASGEGEDNRERGDAALDRPFTPTECAGRVGRIRQRGGLSVGRVGVISMRGCMMAAKSFTERLETRAFFGQLRQQRHRLHMCPKLEKPNWLQHLCKPNEFGLHTLYFFNDYCLENRAIKALKLIYPFANA